jgi:two-component system, cell cycle response regulator
MERPTLLIIDDDPSLSKTLADILRAKGYKTLTTKDGEHGLVTLLEQSVDLVLLDLGLPGVSGLEVLGMIQDHFPQVCVIVLTGQATIDSAIEATNNGAFSYLLKPYEIDKLINHIRRGLEMQQARKEISRYQVELERKNAELKLLYEISLVINRTLDLKELLPAILQTLTETEIFPFKIKGAIFLVEGDVLRLAASFNDSGPMLTPCDGIAVGECLCGLCASTGEPVVVGNVIEDGRPLRCNPEMTPCGRIVIPLKAIDTVVGIFSIYGPPAAEVSAQQLDLLTSMGSQIGIAISNARRYEEAKHSSLHDPLTGLANRRLLQIQMGRCFGAANRYRQKLSVIMIDIDHFKSYNDTRGHLEGDRLLSTLAGVVVKALRNADQIFRYGGEEFLCILPETGLPHAGEVAERIRRVVQVETDVTISLGVASFTADMPNIEALVRKADKALYLAKKRGRNRVEGLVED